jgi:hypothetical protein
MSDDLLIRHEAAGRPVAEPSLHIVHVHIKHTMARYHSVGDRGDNNARAECFLSDGILKTPLWTANGRSEIAALLDRRTPIDGRKPRFVRHHLTTSHVELVEPAHAQARSYFAVYTDRGLDHVGVYNDQFRKHGADSLIAVREVLIDWKADNSYLRQPTWWESVPPP